MLCSRQLVAPCLNYFIFSRSYAVKNVVGTAGMMGLGKGKKGAAGGKGPSTERPVLPVETDVSKLVNYVCGSNIMTTGEDVKLKPDSEYPDWLWNLHVGPPLKLEDLDPTTKKYWLKVRTMGIRRQNLLLKHKRKN